MSINLSNKVFNDANLLPLVAKVGHPVWAPANMWTRWPLRRSISVVTVQEFWASIQSVNGQVGLKTFQSACAQTRSAVWFECAHGILREVLPHQRSFSLSWSWSLSVDWAMIQLKSWINFCCEEGSESLASHPRTRPTDYQRWFHARSERRTPLGCQ